MHLDRPWAIIAAALVIAGTVYAARSIEADEPSPTPPATDEPAPTRPPRIASGPHGGGPSYNIPRIEGRVATGVTHHEYGDIICEYDARVEVSMDALVAEVTEQTDSVRTPVQVGEDVAGFHETNSLYLENPWINPEGVDNILDTPSYEKYRDRGTLPGTVYRNEDGTLHWGCETWLPGGGELPSKEERQRRMIEKIEALGCDTPFCR